MPRKPARRRPVRPGPVARPVTETVDSAALLKLDAHNRAWRTALQGFALDVGVAAALVVYDVTTDESPDYRLLPALLTKTILHSGASYVMRAKIDRSRVPTPLPPAPAAAPSDEVLEGP